MGLLTEFSAQFLIVCTEETDECRVWQERATALHWESLEFFSSYRDRVPGRGYGQQEIAVRACDVDWSEFDIVISIDVSVPAEVAQQFPHTLWCYFIREVKAPSYGASLKAAIRGYDCVLNHCFRLRKPKQASHVLEFPYHLQFYGCFHQLFSTPLPSQGDRHGTFVDHHTMIILSPDERLAIHEFGPVASTVHPGDREVIPTTETLARRTMDPDLKVRLMNSRFFLVTPGIRKVFGTALVEAIAAGCVAIGSPNAFGNHGFFFNRFTSASNTHEAVEKMRKLSSNPALLAREAARQRMMIDYVCFVRPLNDLLLAWDRKCGQLTSPKKAE